MYVFGPKTFRFISFVKFRLFDFDAIGKIRNNEYGKKRVPNFTKIQKLEYSAFLQGLTFYYVKACNWYNFHNLFHYFIRNYTKVCCYKIIHNCVLHLLVINNTDFYEVFFESILRIEQRKLIFKVNHHFLHILSACFYPKDDFKNLAKYLLNLKFKFWNFDWKFFDLKHLGIYDQIPLNFHVCLPPGLF